MSYTDVVQVKVLKAIPESIFPGPKKPGEEFELHTSRARYLTREGYVEVIPKAAAKGAKK